MSGYGLGEVWREYPGKGEDFRLALVLGDSACEGYVYIEATLSILHNARLNEAGFQRALAKMKRKGWLTVVDASECLYKVGPLEGPVRRWPNDLAAPKLSLVR